MRSVLIVAVLVSLGLGLVLQNSYLMSLIFVLVPALMAVEFREHATLRCPHCSRNPVSFNRGSPHNVEFCPHCLYWLKPPWP